MNMSRNIVISWNNRLWKIILFGVAQKSFLCHLSFLLIAWSSESCRFEQLLRISQTLLQGMACSTPGWFVGRILVVVWTCPIVSFDVLDVPPPHIYKDVHFLPCLHKVCNMGLEGGCVLNFAHRTQITAMLPHKLWIFLWHPDVVLPHYLKSIKNNNCLKL